MMHNHAQWNRSTENGFVPQERLKPETPRKSCTILHNALTKSTTYTGADNRNNRTEPPLRKTTFPFGFVPTLFSGPSPTLCIFHHAQPCTITSHPKRWAHSPNRSRNPSRDLS